MKLEQQVTSLEISKKLKELGVKQESLFFWFEDELHTTFNSIQLSENTYSAFTVAELGEMLKVGTNWVNKDFSAGFPEWSEGLNKWEYELPKGAWISCDTEADARGKMLIYLLENKLI